jgi:hypothetical protein
VTFNLFLCDNLASIDKATNEIYGPGIINQIFFLAEKNLQSKLWVYLHLFFFKEFKKNKYFMKLNLTYM